MIDSISIHDCGISYLCLHHYHPKRSGMPDEDTELILNFKNRNAKAIRHIESEMIAAVIPVAFYLQHQLHCRYIIAAPSSKAAVQNYACECVCKALVAQFPWLMYLPQSLQRFTTVPKSSTARPGERPTFETHINSICYAGEPVNAAGQTIILVDDVLTRGATSSACRDILIQATHCEQVFGLFVAKTVYGGYV